MAPCVPRWSRPGHSAAADSTLMCSTAGGWALQRAVTLLESRFTRLRLRRQSNPFPLALRLFQSALNSDSWVLARSEKVRELAINSLSNL